MLWLKKFCRRKEMRKKSVLLEIFDRLVRCVELKWPGGRSGARAAECQF